MVSRSLAVGYHGCDLSVAERIVSSKEHLRPSQNAWDWLGHGIYFWEDSVGRAERWANDECKRPGNQIKNPAVISAVIDLGNCLNLADAEALNQIRAAYDVYREICSRSDAPVAENRGTDLRARYLDCAVIETLHHLRIEDGKQPFDTVRGFFMEGKPLYEGAGFRELDHIQICVRSPKRIIGYFWPRE